MSYQRKRERVIAEESSEGTCFREQADVEEVACEGAGILLQWERKQRTWARQVGGFGGGTVDLSTKKEVRLSPGSSTTDTLCQGQSRQTP